jgi:metal-dependent amidase/aminoacylase/carboxypeptidase family protein
MIIASFSHLIGSSHAHDVLTAFMSKHDFHVTPHHHLETGWKATFSYGEGGRTIGVNSEVLTFAYY